MLKPPTAKSSDQKRQPYFSKDEVALHNVQSDCWVSFFGKVYDLTALVNEHKGWHAHNFCSHLLLTRRILGRAHSSICWTRHNTLVWLEDKIGTSIPPVVLLTLWYFSPRLMFTQNLMLLCPIAHTEGMFIYLLRIPRLLGGQTMVPLGGRIKNTARAIFPRASESCVLSIN